MILVVLKTTLIARDGMSVHLLEPSCALLTSFLHLSESISSNQMVTPWMSLPWDIHSENRTSHSSNIFNGSSELWTLSGLSSHEHYLLTAVPMKRGGSIHLIILIILPSARNPSICSNQSPWCLLNQLTHSFPQPQGLSLRIEDDQNPLVASWITKSFQKNGRYIHLIY